MALLLGARLSLCYHLAYVCMLRGSNAPNNTGFSRCVVLGSVTSGAAGSGAIGPFD